MTDIKTDQKEEVKDQPVESSVVSEAKNTANSPVGKDRFKDIVPGMTVRIYHKIKELNTKGEEKERTAYYEGLVLARKHGNTSGATITVRKISDGVGVEKIFPLNLPSIVKIVVKKSLVRPRRSKLYYLRNYKKRLKEKKVKI